MRWNMGFMFFADHEYNVYSLKEIKTKGEYHF